MSSEEKEKIVPSKLDAEQREAIRLFIFSYAFLPASILSILAFGLGWFINEGARGAAYGDAFSKAQSVIVKLASDAGGAAERASSADKRSGILLGEVSAIKSDIESDAKVVDSIVKNLSEKVNVSPDDVAKALEPVFRSELLPILNQSIVRQKVCKTHKGGDWFGADAVCPKNSFLIGGGCTLSDWVNHSASNGPKGDATWTCNAHDTKGHNVEICAHAICIK